VSEVSPLLIVVAAIFTNNILLSNFLGMCSFLACSREIPTAIGLGTAVTFVMTCTTILNYIIYHGVLKKGAPPPSSSSSRCSSNASAPGSTMPSVSSSP